MRTILSLLAVCMLGQLAMAQKLVPATCNVDQVNYYDSVTNTTWTATQKPNLKWSAPLAAKGHACFVTYSVTPETGGMSAYQPWFDASYGREVGGAFGTEWGWYGSQICYYFGPNPLVQNSQWFAVGAYQPFKNVQGHALTAGDTVKVDFE